MATRKTMYSGKKVIVRTYSAGVHYGVLKSQYGQEVVLKKTRRLWYWKGAASLSEMALSGVKYPSECKFSVVLPEIALTQAIEIIPVSNAAVKSIEGVDEWKAQ